MMDLDVGGCGVCISSNDDGDLPEFLETQIVKARKSHKCCECGDVIPKGSTYERTVGKWNGTVSTYKTCAPCAEIRANLCCDGWTYTMLWEDAEESELFAHLTTGCLEQLSTAAAKAKLLAMWRRWKELE